MPAFSRIIATFLLSFGPYTFTFPTPAAGLVAFAWASGHSIADSVENPFLGAAWNVTRSASGSGELVIHEFAAISTSTFLDENGDKEGWIEIHNPGTNPVNLAGWEFTAINSPWRIRQPPPRNHQLRHDLLHHGRHRPPRDLQRCDQRLGRAFFRMRFSP